MRLAQATVRTLDDQGLGPLAALQPHLVLAFGAPALVSDPGFHPWLRRAFPGAELAGCSTAGEISAAGVTDGCVVVTALRFERPAFRVEATPLASMEDSQAAGERLGRALAGPGLHDLWVFGQGVDINGSALIAGLSQGAGPGVAIAGGLAGDGGAFQKTFTLCGRTVSDRGVVAVGFYRGTRVAHGSFGGWQPFGTARLVTRSRGNVLYELDGARALEVYRKYLGEHASGLPASGLLFPFALLGQDRSAVGLIRTILGVDAEAGSLTFAGDIPQGAYVRLMHASTDALVDGAHLAAQEAAAAGDGAPGVGEALTLAVSCVGRKLVMGGRIDEEVEAVTEVFPGVVAGFYSYGEISPQGLRGDCRLHNQTMTLSRLIETAP